MSGMRLYAVYAVRLVVSASSHTAAAGGIIVASLWPSQGSRVYTQVPLQCTVRFNTNLYQRPSATINCLNQTDQQCTPATYIEAVNCLEVLLGSSIPV